MAVKYSKWSQKYQHFPYQDPPKYIQIGIFRFENKPSGNPDPEAAVKTLEAKKLVKFHWPIFCVVKNVFNSTTRGKKSRNKERFDEVHKNFRIFVTSYLH
jgi:hypothetical protein